MGRALKIRIADLPVNISILWTIRNCRKDTLRRLLRVFAQLREFLNAVRRAATPSTMFFSMAPKGHFADAVPGVRRARFAADGFVALQKTRHEKFARQGGQFDAAPLAVIDELSRFARDRRRAGRREAAGRNR